MNTTPLEEKDQEALAELLDSLRLHWMHCPNESKAKPQYHAKRKRLGVKKGVPDNFIFDPPPNHKSAKGGVIELKRKVGGKVSDEQLDWINYLNDQGWKTAICFGIDDAIKQLRSWGYL